MPYLSIKDLPAAARAHLPEHAQEIYRSAFNKAWFEYADRDADAHEEMAHRIAWAAVKSMYRRDGRQWVVRSSVALPLLKFKEGPPAS